MSVNGWTKRTHKFSYSPFSSVSNLSSVNSSTGIAKKTLQITLPEDFGAQVSENGRVQHLTPNSPAHDSGVVQVGDVVQVTRCRNLKPAHFVTLHVTYSQIQLESRPSVPLMIEIGNQSHTSLGMALSESGWPRRIYIASIQRGSLADRCGYLRTGDTITMVHVKSSGDIESIPCSLYTSCQLAQLLRQLTITMPSVTFSIVPVSYHSNLARSRSLLPERRQGSIEFTWDEEASEVQMSRGGQRSPTPEGTLLSFCLWKDSSFDDWGFSIHDPELKSQEGEECQGSRGPTVVQEIRRGGPAYVVGLLPGDKIMQINDRDVSTYESTILVPILASLEDALNLVVLR